MKIKLKLRISHRIVLCFLFVLVLPLAGSLVLVAGDLERRAAEEVERQAAFALRITRTYLARLREGPLVKLNWAANEEGGLVRALAAGSAEITLALEARRAQSGFSGLSLLDACGHTLAAAGAPVDPEGGPATAARGGENAARFILDDTTPRLEAAVPMTGGGVPPGTVLAGRVDLAADALDTLKDITDMEVSLHPGTGDRRAVTTLVGADARRSRGGGVPPHIRAALHDRALAANDESFLGRPYVVAYAMIEPREPEAGFVSVAIPREAFERASSLIVQSLYGVGALSLLLAVAAGFALSLSIARPLKDFSRMADRIAEGSFEERVLIDRSDEIGDLAFTFNDMAEKLQATMERLERRMFELQTLHSVAQSMNFMNNTEQLLTMILDRSVKALGAARGSLMLVNPETHELEVSVVSGFEGEVTKRLRFRPGEGVAGLALETGRTQLVTDVAADPRFRAYRETEDAERHLRNMLCVPLKIKDEVSGVINIINKRDTRGFTPDDVRLLEALATQAAVTIENAKLYELSITDGMTKLFIHRYFQVRLDEELRRALRYGSEVSLLMTDVDHFKKFNDTYGHQTGDRVLIRVAQVMREAIRKEIDIPCRYGGEEFSVIAPNTGRDDAMVMAERLRRMIEAETLEGPGGEPLRITISLGVATFPGDTRDKKELIRMADRALYFSKEGGRNRATHYADVAAADTETAAPPAGS